MQLKSKFIIPLLFSVFIFSCFCALPQSWGAVFQVDDGGGMTGGLDILTDEMGGTGIPEETSLIKMIMYWVKVVLVLLGTIAFVAFIWAGFLYITSFANEENAEKAKNVMIWCVIGILIILFSYVLTNYLITLGTG